MIVHGQNRWPIHIHLVFWFSFLNSQLLGGTWEECSMDPHPTRNPLFYFLVHIEEFREERDIVGREREENE